MGRCRDCKLYDLDATKSKSGAILSRKIARCLWKSTEVWPASVAPAFSTRPVAGSMRPDDGDRCQRFIKRENS